jgi:hypothetical protein
MLAKVNHTIHAIRMCGQADACLFGFMDSFQLLNWAENRNIPSAKEQKMTIFG